MRKPRHPKTGRPPGSRSLIATPKEALEKFEENRPDQAQRKELLEAARIWAGVARDLATVVQLEKWLSKLQARFGRVGEPPVFGVPDLAQVLGESDLHAHIQELVRGLPVLGLLLQTIGPLTTSLQGIRRDPSFGPLLRRYMNEHIMFAGGALSRARRLAIDAPTPTELMVMAVIEGLQEPDKQDRALDTWEKRLKRAQELLSRDRK